MNHKEKPVCMACGSADVVKDAYAKWSVKKQNWVLHSSYDAAYCHACDISVKLKWVPADEP